MTGLALINERCQAIYSLRGHWDSDDHAAAERYRQAVIIISFIPQCGSFALADRLLSLAESIIEGN